MFVQKRLIEERERLGLNQDQMAIAGGLKKRAYCYYESGERSPDANFLAGVAKLGADVQYIVTGIPSGTSLTNDERELLALFRAAPLAVKASAVGALKGGSTLPTAKIKKQVNVSATGGQAAGRNIVNKGEKRER